MERSATKGVLLAGVAALVWGTVPIGGVIALPGMSAPVLSALRLTVAGLFLMLVLASRKGRALFQRPPRLIYLAALGLGGNYVLYMWGVERTGAGTSQVLIQTAPLFLILLSLVVLGERMSRRQALGTLIAFVGVTLVSWREASGEPRTAFGVLLVLLAALTWAVYAVAHKRLGREHDAGATMMWIFLLSALVALPGAALESWRTPDGVQWLAILYLCMNTVVAYWSFAESLRHIEASTAAVIATLGPVVTLGVLAITNRMDQDRVPFETLSALKLGGAALVLTGVVLAVTARRAPRAEPQR
ncbi:MAG: DMT family transporter [Planctomycetota bacterium]|nr:DMT family transporter [Planctomycetota bacterium]